MKNYFTVICLTIMSLAVGEKSLAQDRLGEINWGDPEIIALRSSGPPPFGPDSGGLESADTSELADVKFPVRALLTSDLSKVFSASQPGLETVYSNTAEEINIPADLQADVIVADDKTHYTILHSLEAGTVQILCEGTRRFAEAPIPDVVLGAPTEEGDHQEIFEARAQEIRYGEALYGCSISCATFEVRSYCEDATYAKEALKRQSLLFPGVQD